MNIRRFCNFFRISVFAEKRCFQASINNYEWHKHTYVWNIEIGKANLGITEASDVVSVLTKVQNHSFSRYVLGQNNELVQGYYTYAAAAVVGGSYTASQNVFTTGEAWGNGENRQVSQDAAEREQTGIMWEFNVNGSKDQNNYCCQYDGDSRSTENHDNTDDRGASHEATYSNKTNSYYSGSNGVLPYAENTTDPEIVVPSNGTPTLDIDMAVTVSWEADQKIKSVDGNGEASSTGSAFAKATSSDYNDYTFKTQTLYFNRGNLQGKTTFSGDALYNGLLPAALQNETITLDLVDLYADRNANVGKTVNILDACRRATGLMITSRWRPPPAGSTGIRMGASSRIKILQELKRCLSSTEFWTAA